MRLKNKYLYKTTILSSSLFLLNGCVPKNSDGTYTSVYSYHPYNKYHTHHTIPRETITPLKREAYAPMATTQRTKYGFQNPLKQNIEQTAKSMLGTRYQFGANGPYSYDCSSFTKHVFSKQGIKLPRISREQAKVGKFIPWNQLQKGDLIFFDSKKSSTVSHVGIYLGEGKFIHESSAKKCVTISSLNSNYYKKHFKWGRRLSNANHYASR